MNRGILFRMNAILGLLVAGSASLITFFVVRRIFQERLRVGPPTLLAALVACLAFVGLRRSGDGLLRALLIPYAALALALLFWFLGLRFTRLAKRPRECLRHPDSNPRTNALRHPESDDRNSVWAEHRSRAGKGHEPKQEPSNPRVAEGPASRAAQDGRWCL